MYRKYYVEHLSVSGLWALTNGFNILSSFQTKEEAVEHASEHAKTHSPSTLIIKDKGGGVQKQHEYK